MGEDNVYNIIPKTDSNFEISSSETSNPSDHEETAGIQKEKLNHPWQLMKLWFWQMIIWLNTPVIDIKIREKVSEPDVIEDRSLDDIPVDEAGDAARVLMGGDRKNVEKTDWYAYLVEELGIQQFLRIFFSQWKTGKTGRMQKI